MSKVYRLYGSTYQSVDFEFEAKALNEVGFRRNQEESIPATSQTILPSSRGLIGTTMVLPQVIRLVRLRSAGGTPIGIEATTLPADVLKKPEKVGASLYAALDKGGFRPARAIQRVAAAGFSKKDAKQLGVKKGDPALAVRRVGYLAGGRAVEVTEALYLADRYDMIAELRG